MLSMIYMTRSNLSVPPSALSSEFCPAGRTRDFNLSSSLRNTDLLGTVRTRVDMMRLPVPYACLRLPQFLSNPVCLFTVPPVFGHTFPVIL